MDHKIEELSIAYFKSYLARCRGVCCERKKLEDFRNEVYQELKKNNIIFSGVTSDDDQILNVNELFKVILYKFTTVLWTGRKDTFTRLRSLCNCNVDEICSLLQSISEGPHVDKKLHFLTALYLL